MVDRLAWTCLKRRITKTLYQFSLPKCTGAGHLNTFPCTSNPLWVKASSKCKTMFFAKIIRLNKSSILITINLSKHVYNYVLTHQRLVLSHRKDKEIGVDHQDIEQLVNASQPNIQTCYLAVSVLKVLTLL